MWALDFRAPPDGGARSPLHAVGSACRMAMAISMIAAAIRRMPVGNGRLPRRGSSFAWGESKSKAAKSSFAPANSRITLATFGITPDRPHSGKP